MSDQSPHENNRARVRRLLFDPLGFRFDRTSREGKDPEQAKRALDRIADDLAHLTDRELRHMVEMLQAKGEGSKRCFWPGFATFRGHAEAIHPRPIQSLPEMRSWFGSVEGPKARADGTLVETYDFMLKHKRPPYLPKDREQIAAQSEEAARRLRVIERHKRQGTFTPDTSAIDRKEAEWESRYIARRAYVDELVTIIAEEKARAEGRA